MAAARLKVERHRPRSTREQLLKTIALVGRGVRAGSVYPPIRMWASAVAARAHPPKNYLKQLGELYGEFTRKWRYVRDPLFAELVHVSGPAIWDHVFGNVGGIGRGDCDCATAAFGAAAASIGFPVRLCTSSPLSAAPGAPPRHIYPEVFVKGLNRWIPADPVVFPKHGLGYASPAREIARWDLYGRNISGELAGEEVSAMFGEVENSMRDYGLEAYGYASLGGEPAPWGAYYGPIGFGAYADTMGIMGGFGMFAEVEEDGYGLARTPMLELHPRDFDHMRRCGRPYHGMAAIGDDGSVYQWDGLSGFFSKIFKGAKKLIGGVVKGSMKVVKGIGGKVWNLTKKVLSKLPGGKYIIKFTEKIHGMAMKLVRPLLKVAGRLAKKIAPIAAMIPGYGPVISAALYAGGTAAGVMSKWGVKQGKKGQLIMPHNAAKVKGFQAEMKKAAAAKRKDVAELAKKGMSPKQIVAHHAAMKGKRKAVAPGHAPAGTPEHKAALRAQGVTIPQAATAVPTLAPATVSPPSGAWAPPPEYWAQEQAEWAKAHPAAGAPAAGPTPAA